MLYTVAYSAWFICIFQRVVVQAVIEWPSPDSLVLEVPFNNDSLLQDRICKQLPFNTGVPRLVVDSPGPFGLNGTSMSVTPFGSWIAEYRDIPLKSGLTVSMFVSTSTDHPAGFFQIFFNDPYNSTIAVSSSDGNGSIDISHRVKNTLVSWQSPQHFTKNNTWQWFAVIYDAANGNYIEAIEDSYSQSVVTMGIEKPIRILLGQAPNTKGTILPMRGTDAVACLAVYDKAIDFDQLENIRKACQVTPPAKPAAACLRTTTTTAPVTTVKALAPPTTTSKAISAYDFQTYTALVLYILLIMMQ